MTLILIIEMNNYSWFLTKLNVLIAGHECLQRRTSGALSQKSSEETFLPHLCFQTFYISSHCLKIGTCDNQKA